MFTIKLYNIIKIMRKGIKKKCYFTCSFKIIYLFRCLTFIQHFCRWYEVRAIENVMLILVLSLFRLRWMLVHFIWYFIVIWNLWKLVLFQDGVNSKFSKSTIYLGSSEIVPSCKRWAGFSKRARSKSCKIKKNGSPKKCTFSVRYNFWIDSKSDSNFCCYFSCFIAAVWILFID